MSGSRDADDGIISVNTEEGDVESNTADDGIGDKEDASVDITDEVESSARVEECGVLQILPEEVSQMCTTRQRTLYMPEVCVQPVLDVLLEKDIAPSSQTCIMATITMWGRAPDVSEDIPLEWSLSSLESESLESESLESEIRRWWGHSVGTFINAHTVKYNSWSLHFPLVEMILP